MLRALRVLGRQDGVPVAGDGGIGPVPHSAGDLDAVVNLLRDVRAKLRGHRLDQKEVLLRQRPAPSRGALDRRPPVRAAVRAGQVIP